MRSKVRTRRSVLAGIGLSAVLLAAIVAAAPATEPGADTVFLNGRVLQYTDDAPGKTNGGRGKEFSQGLAVEDGVITYVGSQKGARRHIGADTEVVDLGGKLMMPGLGDGHWHGAGFVRCNMNYEGGTIPEVLGKLKDCLLKDSEVGDLNTNLVLTASNLQGDGLLPKGTQLDRHLLDRLSADPADDPFGTGTTRPIVVRNMDGHKFATNTQAIINAGLDENTPDPPDGFIGRDPDGFPNGQFADFSANFGPSPPAPPDATYTFRAAAIQRSNSEGITSILRPGGGNNDLLIAKRLADEGKLTVHMNQALSASSVRGQTDPAAIESIISGLNTSRATYDGYSSPASPGDLTVDTVKIFCDGVPEFPGQTAAMLEPYRINIGTPEKPEWVPSDRIGEDPSCEDGRLGFTKLDAAQWNIHTHSLGDRAVRVTLDNFEAAGEENPDWDRRHTITHMQFVDDADIPRFGELGVVASMSLQWSRRDAWSVDGITGYIAPDRMDRLYPAGSVAEGGAVVAYGSDWPVTDLMPWTGIESGITRAGEPNAAQAIYQGSLKPASERLTRLESVKASTIGVAYQLHQEDVTGSIEEGKLADLIVTDQNIFKVPVWDISETNVLMTMLNGEVVYSDPDNPVID